jgi:hypothetical protein
VASERANRRKPTIRGACDPRTHIASGFVTYVEQFVSSNWREVFASTGWRPSRAVVIPRRQLDEETVRWLAEFHRLNPPEE